MERDIHLGSNKVRMWASGGTGNIDLLTANVNLTGWGSKVVVGQVNNTANSADVYAPTRDSYFPTIAGVADNGNVYIEYAGGPSGSRIVHFHLQYRLSPPIELRQLEGEITGDPFPFREVTVHGRTDVDIIVDDLQHRVLV